MKKAFSFLIFLLAWLMLLPSCFAETAVLPPPTEDIYLVDDANMVDPEDRQKILAMGRDLDRATKAQVVVVTINSLGPDSIEDYANRLFRKWGIGDRKKNNGVLLLIAKEDRKFRIEVGYGLEGAITDGYSGSVLDGMKADFRSGKYSPAIVAAYGKLTQKAYEAENMTAPENVGAATAATNAASPSSEEDEEWTWPEILLGVPIGLLLVGALFWCLWQMLRLVFMLFALLLFLLTSGAIDLTDFIHFGGGGGGGGGGFSGGGWSGGGGGGGGGFGGGSSGGGGSSSGW